MKYLIVMLVLMSSLFAEDTKKEYNAILTAYCPCESCCSYFWKDGKPYFKLRPNVVKKIGQTASGKQAKANHTLAVPREYPFGTKFYARMGTDKYVLIGVAEDRGGAIIKKKGIVKIDIYFDSHQEALNFGVQKVMLTLVELPDMDASKIIRVVK